MKNLTSISKSYLSSSLSRFFALVTTILLTPLLIQSYGVEGFAFWGVIVQVYMMAVIADLGIANGLHNTLTTAAFKGSKDRQLLLARECISLVFLISIGITIAVTVILCICEYFFNGLTPASNWTDGGVIFIAMVAFMLNLPFGVLQKVQFSEMDHHKFYLYESFSKLLALIGVMGCLYFKTKMWVAMLFFLLPMPVCSLINASNYKKYDLLKFINPLPLSQDLANVIRRGAAFLVISLLYLLGRSTDILIVTSVSGLSVSADYQIMCRLFDIPFMAFTMLTAILWSAFSNWLSSGLATKVRRAFISFSIAASLFYLVLFVFLLGFGDSMLSYWLGEQVEFDSGIYQWFCVWYYLLTIYNLIAAFLKASDLLMVQVKTFMAYACISPILKVYVLSEYRLIEFLIVGSTLFFILVVLPSGFVAIKTLNEPLKTKVSIHTAKEVGGTH